MGAASIFIGIFVLLFGIFALSDGNEAGLLLFLMGLVLVLFGLVLGALPAEVYDVVCGDNVYKEVALRIEQDYLKITQDNGAVAYERGPCAWKQLRP